MITVKRSLHTSTQ